jgi:G3E family GTPase
MVVIDIGLRQEFVALHPVTWRRVSVRDVNCSHQCHDRDHAKAFSTWSYETDRALSLEALREALSKLPAPIYRAKGVIYVADAPQRRAVLQVVGRRVDVSLMDAWGERTPRTQIVAIGAAGTIDERALRATFEQCVGTRR